MEFLIRMSMKNNLYSFTLFYCIFEIIKCDLLEVARNDKVVYFTVFL